jgi:DNA-binding transcriptional MocR family regulator
VGVEGLTQFVPAPGVIDLGWGHPDPDLVPVAELRAAAARALDRYGADMLAYGHAAGPLPLREFVAARLAQTDARAPTPDEIVITGGTSQGLDMVATLLVEPGDTVLVSEPTYYLALRILAEDHRFEVGGVRSDADGLGVDLDDLARAVRHAREGGHARRAGTRGGGSAAVSRERPRVFLYTIPTFNNPTGGSLPDERRRALVDLAAREDIVILEDDTYRELAYDGPTPPSLWALAAPGTVVRLGSFAKSVAPGLRCGYLTADAPTAERIALSGLLDSGGSPSQFTAVVLAEYAAAGDYVRVVERFRAAYRAGRDALLGALDARLGEAATPLRPRGGYFVWVRLPDGVTAAAVEREATGCGTGFMPARVFYVHPERAPEAIRLSFARYPPAVLEEAASRVAAAIERAGSR